MLGIISSCSDFLENDPRGVLSVIRDIRTKNVTIQSDVIAAAQTMPASHGKRSVQPTHMAVPSPIAWRTVKSQTWSANRCSAASARNHASGHKFRRTKRR